MLKRLLLILLATATCLTASVAGPNTPAVITEVNPSGVDVNFGQAQRAQSGQEFFIYRNGQWVGRIRLTQVGDNTSTGIVIQTPPGSSVQVGDVISSYPPDRLATVSAPVVPSVPPPPAPQLPYQPYNGPPFQELLKKRTHSYTFDAPVAGMPPQFRPSPNYALYGMMASPFLFGSSIAYSPWSLAMTGYQVNQQVQFHKMMKKDYDSTKSSVTVVYWDADLLNAYASRYVATNVSDPGQQAQMRSSMIAQKGIDKSFVFQVQLTNRGFSPLNVAPFNTHFFLLDDHGNRVQPRRYDEALDANLQGGGSQSQGYVYFDRFDPSGNPTTTGRVKVVFDVQGASTTIGF